MAVRHYTTMARRYAEAVVGGDIAACKWVQLACQRQLDDLERFQGKDSPYRFNPVLVDKQGRRFQPADNLCAFVERLPHVKGPLAGQPIHLEPWQVFILTTVFGWVKPDGKRRFRRAYIEVPRGSGKSALSSAVALYMLAADGEGGAEVYGFVTVTPQGEPEELLAVIVDFTFNLGAGLLLTSKLRRRVNQRDWAASDHGLSRWIYGGGKVLPGLVARRKAEAALVSGLRY